MVSSPLNWVTRTLHPQAPPQSVPDTTPWLFQPQPHPEACGPAPLLRPEAPAAWSLVLCVFRRTQGGKKRSGLRWSQRCDVEFVAVAARQERLTWGPAEMPAGPVSVRFVPSAGRTWCSGGQTESWCACSWPSPPPSTPPRLLELCPPAASHKQEVKLKRFTC